MPNIAKQSRLYFSIGFLILAIGSVAFIFTPMAPRVLSKVERIIHGPAPPKEIERVVEKEVEKIVEKEVFVERRPTMSPRIDRDHHFGKLFNGVNIDAETIFESGESSSIERKNDDAYLASLSIKLKIPKAGTSLEQLDEKSEDLEKMLPGLPDLLAGAKISPFFDGLYKNKRKRIEQNVMELAKVLSRHNYYDCDTILEAEHPETKQKVLIVQSEMDVVADGSDGDRLSEMSPEVVNSTHYQPFTSYSWRKQTNKENPMIAGWAQRIQNAHEELANPATTAARAQWLRNRVKYLKTGIEDMKSNSFLVAAYDPFIVMPTNMIVDRKNKFAPKAGDYAVVIYKDKIYPVIVGDAGPTFKMGEGSLRLAKEINKKASPYHRPVSDLAVTYIVFPSSRESSRVQPDYKAWKEKCSMLLQRVGGLSADYQLHDWEDTFPKPEPVITENEVVLGGAENANSSSITGGEIQVEESLESSSSE